MLPSTTPTNIFQSCSWRLPYLEQAHSLDEPSHERNHRIASKKIQKCESPTEFCCIRRLSEGYALLVLQTSLGPAQNTYIYIYRSLRSLLKGKLLSKNLLPLVERILRRLKLPAVPGRSVMPGRSPQQSPRKCPNAVCVPRHKRINQRAQNLVMLRCFKTCPLTSVESNADPCKQPGG